MIDLDFLLKSPQICQKCTILSNLRTVAQEEKKETRQMTSISIYFLSPNSLWYSFLYLKIVKIHFHEVPPLAHSGCAKYLNLGDKNCEIRIFPRSIQETYTSRKLKNQVLLFLSSREPNLSDLSVYTVWAKIWLRMYETFDLSLMLFSFISRTMVDTKRDNFTSTVNSVFGYSKKLLMAKTDAYEFIEDNFFSCYH